MEFNPLRTYHTNMQRTSFLSDSRPWIDVDHFKPLQMSFSETRIPFQMSALWSQIQWLDICEKCLKGKRFTLTYLVKGPYSCWQDDRESGSSYLDSQEAKRGGWGSFRNVLRKIKESRTWCPPMAIFFHWVSALHFSTFQYSCHIWMHQESNHMTEVSILMI